MRYAVSFLVLASIAAAQGTANAPSSVTSALSPDQENERRAKAIIDQGIQALGGQVYLTWRTQSSEGRSYGFHHGEARGVGNLFWRFKQYPDKERIELTKKRDIIEVFNADQGYEVTYRGARSLNDKDELQPYLRRRHYSLDIVLREWINDPGAAFFYEGQTVAAQKQTDQVTIMNAKNEAVTLNFDVDSHLPVRKSFTWRDPADKEKNVEEEIYDNYRLVQGIMTPYDVTRTFNGDMAFQMFLNDAGYNQQLSADMFNAQATANRR